MWISDPITITISRQTQANTVGGEGMGGGGGGGRLGGEGGTGHRGSV